MIVYKACMKLYKICMILYKVFMIVYIGYCDIENNSLADEHGSPHRPLLEVPINIRLNLVHNLNLPINPGPYLDLRRSVLLIILITATNLIRFRHFLHLQHNQRSILFPIPLLQSIQHLQFEIVTELLIQKIRDKNTLCHV